MLFESWLGVARVLIVGACAYVALIVILRLSGKRTLSKMNAFDFVVTVALGSTLATVALSRQVPLVEGMLGIALLVLLQLIVTWASLTWPRFGRWVKSEPTVLYHRGRFVHAALRRERVTEAEVIAAVRAQGIASLESVEAVVLETDGTFSALRRASQGEQATALRGTDFDPARTDGSTRD
jgi:uncharacterized membrane protein YcaP (DUF421 family)